MFGNLTYQCTCDPTARLGALLIAKIVLIYARQKSADLCSGTIPHSGNPAGPRVRRFEKFVGAKIMMQALDCMNNLKYGFASP
jgi:hypothetical protein